MNKTVINGTPLQNSMNTTEVYFINGSSDLLPRAKAIPTGKQKKIEKTQKYSESSGHHQLRYTLLLMVISISGDAYESILSF